MSIAESNRGFRVRVYDKRVKRSRHVGYYKTIREAKRAEAEAVTTEQSPHAALTVAEWRDRWLTGAHRIAPRKPWKESTMRAYGEQTKPFLEEMGNRRLNSIDKAEAFEWLRKRPQDHKVLRTLYADAALVGLSTVNPFATQKIPKPLGRKRLPDDFLTAEKEERLIEAALSVHGETYGAMIRTLIILASDCGLRRGELFALRWESVDLKERELVIDRAWVERVNEYDTPKGDNVDSVRLTERAAEALRDCPRLHPSLVFTSSSGKPLRGSSWAFAFDKVKARAGLDEVTIHWFRHYTATRLANAGVPFHDIAIHLRHRDGGDLVRQLYAHPNKDASRSRAISALDRGDLLVTTPV